MAKGARAIVEPSDSLLAKTYLLSAIAEKEHQLRVYKGTVLGLLIVPAAVVWLVRDDPVPTLT